MVQQSWRDVAFLHWRADPYEVAKLLPPGLVPDVVDGSAWIGLTPFEVRRFRVLDAPPLPFGATDFPETNVRTYVRDEHGTDGLWFLSLDVPDVLNAMGGRLAGAPYKLADMTVTREDGAGVVHYRSRRRVGTPAYHQLTVRPGRAMAEDEVDDTIASLTGRWRAFSRVAGQLVVIAVEHEPWPLRHATLAECDESLLAAAGVTDAIRRDTPMVHFSDGVDARIGAARLASGATVASLLGRFGRSDPG